MFGPRLSRIFASRNNALWWSAMVLVTAYCVAAEPPTVTAVGANDEDAAQEEGQGHAGKQADPWADMKAAARKRDQLLP
ncbi:hypothetical protein [Parasphingorhabdus sp.]|uniref:hypothetical protein n=1 Tax=Parasphingorhabdus sp. TaxID=2709688 RepID=UPI002F95A230